MEKLYEDKESQEMIRIINEQHERALKEKVQMNKNREQKEDIKLLVKLILAVVLFVILFIQVIKVNTKLNKQEMNACLQNNTQEYCSQNTGWGVK